MNQVIERRNKNAHKTLIDYDLNIFILEELDEWGNSYWDPANWKIHVFVHRDDQQYEWDDAIQLTAEEIRGLGLNQDESFSEVDSWFGLDGFRYYYWDKMSDRLKKYFDELPKYYEDIIV